MTVRSFLASRAAPHSETEEFIWRIGCIGYESRARHFFSSNCLEGALSTAFVFNQQQELEFNNNKVFFLSQGFEEISIPEEKSELENLIEQVTKKAFEQAQLRDATTVRIVADISSMTRQMISLIPFFASTTFFPGRVVCEFCYSPAEFGELPAVNGPILSDGPVYDKLAGWGRCPNAPCGLVVGIGYEQDLALGVIEDLEAGEVWAFRPRNPDHKYDEAIDAHNKGLNDRIRPSNRVRYSIYDPYALFVSLNQLVASAKYDFRIILVPFGPKIFALCASIVALQHYPELGLWRVSAGPNLSPVDRKPTGEIYKLFVTFTSP